MRSRKGFPSFAVKSEMVLNPPPPPPPPFLSTSPQKRSGGFSFCCYRWTEKGPFFFLFFSPPLVLILKCEIPKQGFPCSHGLFIFPPPGYQDTRVLGYFFLFFFGSFFPFSVLPFSTRYALFFPPYYQGQGKLSPPPLLSPCYTFLFTQPHRVLLRSRSDFFPFRGTTKKKANPFPPLCP